MAQAPVCQHVFTLEDGDVVITAAWCTDRLAGAEELSGVGERPFALFLLLDPDRAVQAEPGPPPPYPAPAAQGHELAGLRRQLTAAWEFDGVVHRGGGRSVGRRAPDDPGRAALVFGARHPDGADRARRVPPGVPADRRPDRLPHRPAWSHPACAGPHHPEPAGRNGGRAAAAAAQPDAGDAAAPVHLLVDSTGLKLCGPGEWLIEKHGNK